MTNEPRDPDAIVERLVRLADPGPDIPPDGAARIQALIRPAWRREVRARATRRYVTWGAALAAAASLIAFVILPRLDQTAAGPAARIELAIGTIHLDPEQGRDAIAPGSRIVTGQASRVAIRMASGSSVRLDVDSGIRLVSANVVVLDAGAVYVDSADALEPIEIRTDRGVIRDVGTQFEVRRERDSLLVRVREGSVAITADGEAILVESGSEIALARDGSHQTSSIAADAPAWSWIHNVAPHFQLEGRSVASFLRWVSRETGAPIRYEDREVERIASSTVLHGSLGVLRPDEAPGVILPSAGLEARRDSSGALVVKRLSSIERR